MQKAINRFVAPFVGFVLFSCAGSVYDAGRSSLRRQQYNEAINFFQMAVETDSLNHRNFRELGIAYFKADSSNHALINLRRAHQMQPRDGTTVLYLGIVNEHIENYKTALSFYRKYVESSRFTNTRRQIKSRLVSLTRKMIRQEVQAAIKSEPPVRDSTIAVYFKGIEGNAELEPLQKGFAEYVSYGLEQIGELQVLERTRLEVIFEELARVDSLSRQMRNPPRLRRLLGAETLIIGNVSELNRQEGTIRIDVSLVESASAEVRAFGDVVGNINEPFRLCRDLVQQIATHMGLPLTKEELKAIYEGPAENLIAFLNFSRGLQYDDEGRFEDALAAYRSVVSQDNNFARVKRKQGEVSDLRDVEPLPDFTNTLNDDLFGRTNAERLAASGAQVNAGIIPGQDERDSLQEASGTEGFLGVPVQLEIVIPPLPNTKQ